MDDDRPFGSAGLVAAALTLWREEMLPLTGIAFLGQMIVLAVVGLVQTLIGGTGAWFGVFFGPVIAGVVVMMAADAVATRPYTLNAHLRHVFDRFSQVVLLSVAAYVLVLLGATLILPAFLLGAIFLPLLPVILFEQKGWGALARCWDLSRPYLWPLLGVLLLLVVVSALILLPGLGLWLLVREQAGLAILAEGISALFGAAITVVTAVTSVMVYHRLRTLTDGGDISDVFN